MPKLFPIHIEVEELAVGRVMRQLHNMEGVAKVNLDLGEAPRKANGGYNPTQRNSQKFAEKAEDFIMGILAKDQTSTKVLREHFADVGRRPGSTSSALNLLVKDNLIKKVEGSKDWMLTKKARDRLRGRKK